MACDSIVMSSGAQIMIHKPLSWAYGNADDFQRLISELDKCQKSITDIYMGRVKEGVTEEQVTDLINAETWMTAEEAREIFDVQIEERPAVAACVGWMMENFKKAPEGIKTQSADDVTAKITAEEEAIIEEMELFGI
jgi:ATP-dependent Clp protease protease subunit